MSRSEVKRVVLNKISSSVLPMSSMSMQSAIAFGLGKEQPKMKVWTVKPVQSGSLQKVEDVLRAARVVATFGYETKHFVQ